jgi:hypothetical protein
MELFISGAFASVFPRSRPIAATPLLRLRIAPKTGAFLQRHSILLNIWWGSIAALLLVVNKNHRSVKEEFGTLAAMGRGM